MSVWKLWPCGCSFVTRDEVQDHDCPARAPQAMCVCGHERRQHNAGRGSCGAMAAASRLWDDCRQFRPLDGAA